MLKVCTLFQIILVQFKCYGLKNVMQPKKNVTITIKYEMYSQYVKVYIVYKLKYLFVIVYQEFWNEYSALGISLQRHIEYQPTLNG